MRGGMTELSERLLALQDNLGDTAFARKCNVPLGTMRKYLTGSVPGMDNLIKIAQGNEVSIDWLATGKGKRSTLPEAKKIKSMGELMRESKQVYSEAAAEIDYEPPVFIAEHIKNLIFTASLKGKIEVEHIAMLLGALKEELNSNDQ